MNTINKKQMDKVLAPIFWVLKTFGTREGYTKLIVWNMVINLIASIAYIVQEHYFFSFVPFGIVVLCGWILNESYKTNRQPVDSFASFVITVMWTTNAFMTILGNPNFTIIPILIIGGAAMITLVSWFWVTDHIKMEIKQFLTVEENEHHGIR